MLNVAADNKAKIAKCGGIEAIVAAMKHYTGNASVQRLAIGALGSLALNGTRRLFACFLG
jgi:hypothetical protein